MSQMRLSRQGLTSGEVRRDGGAVDAQGPDVEVVHPDHALDALQVTEHRAGGRGGDAPSAAGRLCAAQSQLTERLQAIVLHCYC